MGQEKTQFLSYISCFLYLINPTSLKGARWWKKSPNFALNPRPLFATSQACLVCAIYWDGGYPLDIIQWVIDILEWVVIFAWSGVGDRSVFASETEDPNFGFQPLTHRTHFLPILNQSDQSLTLQQRNIKDSRSIRCFFCGLLIAFFCFCRFEFLCGPALIHLVFTYKYSLQCLSDDCARYVCQDYVCIWYPAAFYMVCVHDG